MGSIPPTAPVTVVALSNGVVTAVVLSDGVPTPTDLEDLRLSIATHSKCLIRFVQ